MAAKNLILRRGSDKEKVNRNPKGPAVQKCPIFSVHYLGKMPARGEYGREYIAEPVEALLKLRDRQKTPEKSDLQITEKGFHFLDYNGAFGKEKHVLIPIHHICYGVADEQNPKVFAIITRTDSNPDNSLFECHAFHCKRKKEAGEITYWLLRTFLEVFEDLQRRRKERQERKLLRLQSGLGGAKGPAFEMSPSESVNASDSTMYSVILDGSKTRGAAVRLARNSGKSRPLSFPPSGISDEAGTSPLLPGLTSPREVYSVAGPGMSYPPNGPGIKPQDQIDMMRHKQVDKHLNQPYSSRLAFGTNDRSPYPQGTPSTILNPSSDQRNSFTQRDGRKYSKNPSLTKSRSFNANPSPSDETNSSFNSDSFSGVSREEADFLFIEMLQEEFGGLDSPRVISKKPMRYEPPDQKLRSEDIEKRVREWLEYEEGDVAVPLNSPTKGSPATIRSPAGYNPGYIYQHSGYRDDIQRHGGKRTDSQSSVTSASDKDYF